MSERKSQSGSVLPIISFDDFLKVDIRLGTIIQAQVFEDARKAAYQLWIDFGEPLGVKKSSAQITKHYALGELIGRRVAAVVNFEPKQIGKFMSEVLTLGFPDRNGEVVLVGVDRNAPDGGKLF
ncbi:MAG: tRNA-binding protein [Alphaproteobacteria bacterium]|nr:tRNA-binding protein [Alphaproteobacteria bacterium]